MLWLLLKPGLFFSFIFLGELFLPQITLQETYQRWDWFLNIVGLMMQGLFVPVCGYILATTYLPLLWPTGKGILPFHWWGGFLLNFVGIDFLYYWQHRLMHHIPWAWQWHRCHHASPRVDIWATARNSLFINFFFVYMLLNPVLGYLCEDAAGFFTAATLTACLDVIRHCRINMEAIPVLNTMTSWLGLIFVTPIHHHRHHSAVDEPANFGANFIIWDKLFNTFSVKKNYPSQYRDINSLSPLQQLFYPFKD